MSAAKKPAHTPGEWKQYPILSGSENDKGFRIVAPDGRTGITWIADVSPVIDNERGDASAEGKANASLICAAPKLLRALRAAREPIASDAFSYSTHRSLLAQVDAAIAEAEAGHGD